MSYLEGNFFIMNSKSNAHWISPFLNIEKVIYLMIFKKKTNTKTMTY